MLHYKPRLRPATPVSKWVASSDSKNRGFVLGGASIYGSCRSSYPWTANGFNPNDDSFWNSLPGTYYDSNNMPPGFILDSGFIRTVISSETWANITRFAGIGIFNPSSFSSYGLQTDISGTGDYGIVDHQLPGTPYCATSLTLFSGASKWALVMGFFSDIYYQNDRIPQAKVINPEYKVTQTRVRARATVTNEANTLTLGRIAIEIFESTSSPFLNMSVSFVPSLYFDKIYITHGIDPDVGSTVGWGSTTYNYAGCLKSNTINHPFGIKKITAEERSTSNEDPIGEYNLTLISKDSQEYLNKVRINQNWPAVSVDFLWEQDELIFQATNADYSLEAMSYFINVPQNEMKTAVFGYQFGPEI